MPPRHFNAARRGHAARRALNGLLVGALVCAGSVATSQAAGWTREPVPRLPDNPLTLARLPEATPPPAEAKNQEPEAAQPKKWGPTQIVIYKARRSLAVYRHGDFYREYPVVLGLNPEGRKRHADDARTPEGLYRVVRKRPHARWQYFLDLDYPNARDREIYAREKAAGRIPDEDGQPFPIGGSIGIHGNDRADQQAAGLDWTKGCIALDPSDIAEVEALTPVGTPVWIVQ